MIARPVDLLDIIILNHHLSLDRYSPLQDLLFHLQWLHASLPSLSPGYPFHGGPEKKSNLSNNLNNANNSNNELLLYLVDDIFWHMGFNSADRQEKFVI